MKIGVLSQKPNSYTCTRIKEAARERGHKIRVYDTMAFSIYLEQEKPMLAYKGKLLTGVDAIVPRVGTTITFFGTSVVRHFEQMGIYTLNTAEAITKSRDKLCSLQTLSRHNIGIPQTAFVGKPEDISAALDEIGGAPVIIKVLEGTQGIGVMLAETKSAALAIVETLHSQNINVLLQRFVSESKGKDVRAFVIGDKVVAAIRRQAEGSEFRSNIHRGAKAAVVELSEEYRQTALQAAQILGLNVAGVDMLEGRDGPQIMEVNSSPGMEGIEKASGVDVAGAMIEYMEQQVNFPNIDLRQRMTVDGGYGIVDLRVSKKSELVGKRLSESGLRARGVFILSISRPETVKLTPTGDDKIQEGDTLLCFGPHSVLREILPAKRKRAPKKS